jgi:hypothetical protein
LNVTAHNIKEGTYTDQITGNKFTVSGGRIKGNIGSTGIAVVYNGSSCSHASHSIDGYCTACYVSVAHNYGANGTCVCGATATRTVYFCNNANWSKVNFYSWYTNGGEIAGKWPGKAMTWVESNIYSCTVPGDAKNIIFNNGSAQTADLTIPVLSSGKNMYDYATGQWAAYIPASVDETEPEETTPTQTQPEETEPAVTEPTVTEPVVTEPTEPTEEGTTDPTETDDTEGTEPETVPSQPTDPAATEPTAAPEKPKEEGNSWPMILTMALLAVAVTMILLRRSKKT